MEVVELLIYIILVFVLLSLIGIMSWLLYDYNNLKTKLTGDFQTINNTFSSHKKKDNTLEDDINSNSSNIINTSNYVDLNASHTSNYILDVKTNISSELTKSESNTRDYIGIVEERAEALDTNFSTFHNNLNKYFTFGTSGEDISGADKKIYNYIFDGDLTEKDKRLELMYETTIAQDMIVNGVVKANSDVKLKTNSINNLKVCNANALGKIDTCFDIYKDGANLIIKRPDNGDIIIGNGVASESLVVGIDTIEYKGTDLLKTPHTDDKSLE
jgi:predicted transcriptional regulator YdeE